MIVDSSNVLFCTLDNATIDNIVARLYRQVARNSLTKDAIIIRMHNATIEKNVLNVITRDEDHEDQITIDHEMIDFSELSIAFLISAIFKDSQRCSFNIKNRRYIYYSMSLVI
jgi:hypothetical protein